MPGWGIIYDTAAGNGPHYDTLGTGGFLPHGLALMMPSQNVETRHVRLICVQVPVKSIPPGPPLPFFCPFSLAEAAAKSQLFR